jgi:membrane protein YdbS with pleckstrin-like domain
VITAVRNRLLALMKVPPEPTPPAGSHGSLRVFRAARNFYRLLLIKWAMKQAGVIIGILVSLSFLQQWTSGMNQYLALLVRFAEGAGIIVVLAQMPFTLALVKFDFELRWYIVTDRSLRIRSGIWHIREMTMTFANIQQISVEQGPLQRFLGLADVMVRTAGGGSGSETDPNQKGAQDQMHIGYFHGVNNAGEIRDMIVERMRNLRDAGLGDPDDAAEVVEEAASGGELLEAARELAGEARALRLALEPPT